MRRDAMLHAAPQHLNPWCPSLSPQRDCRAIPRRWRWAARHSRTACRATSAQGSPPTRRWLPTLRVQVTRHASASSGARSRSATVGLKVKISPRSSCHTHDQVVYPTCLRLIKSIVFKMSLPCLLGASSDGSWSYLLLRYFVILIR